MKRWSALFLCVLCLFTVTGCQKREEQKQLTQICIEVETKDNGSCSMLSDVTLDYNEGKLTSIFVEKPTVLSYKVPGSFHGGVCLMEGEDLAWIIQGLEAAWTATDQRDTDQAKELLSTLIEFFRLQAVLEDSPT